MKTTTRKAKARAEGTAEAGRTLRYDAGTRTLTITAGKETKSYHVQPVRDDFGLAVLGYRLTKADGEFYDVDPAEGACHCMGSLRYGKCRHVAAVCKLLSLNMLDR